MITEDYLDGSIQIDPRGASASYRLFSERFGLPRELKARFSISRDRRVLRMRIRGARLRGAVFSALEATAFGGRGKRETVAALFTVPLRYLSLSVTQGDFLRVYSTPGAYVRVSIRRNREKPVIVRYRQPRGLEYKKIRYRLSCRKRRTTYKIVARARDRYGNRLTERRTLSSAGADDSRSCKITK